MLFLEGVGSKEYSSVVGVKGSRLPELRCPLPGCGERLAGHGGYKRYVGGRLAWIRRGICARCGVSHAIVAQDLVAYRDLTLGELETLWEASGAAQRPLLCDPAREDTGLPGLGREPMILRQAVPSARSPEATQG